MFCPLPYSSSELAFSKEHPLGARALPPGGQEEERVALPMRARSLLGKHSPSGSSQAARIYPEIARHEDSLKRKL